MEVKKKMEVEKSDGGKEKYWRCRKEIEVEKSDGGKEK